MWIMKLLPPHSRNHLPALWIVALLIACSPGSTVSGATLLTNLTYLGSEQVVRFEVETDSPSFGFYQGTTISNIQISGTGADFPAVSGLKHYAPAQSSSGFYRLGESTTDLTLSSVVPSLVGKTYQAGGAYYRFDDGNSGKQFYGGSSEYDFTYTLEHTGPGVAQLQFGLADGYREYLTLYFLQTGGGLLSRVIQEGPGGQVLFSPESLSETTPYGTIPGTAPSSLIGPNWSITLGPQSYPVNFTSSTEASFPDAGTGSPTTVPYEYILTGKATATLRIHYPGQDIRVLWLTFNDAAGTSADILFPTAGFSFIGVNLGEASLNISL